MIIKFLFYYIFKMTNIHVVFYNKLNICIVNNYNKFDKRHDNSFFFSRCKL